MIGRVCPLLVVVALAGCGLAVKPAGSGATAAAVVAGSTFPPAPKSSTPPSFPPCSPTATAAPGIDNNATQVGPDSWETFVTTNQWRGPASGSATRWYHVYAGMSGDAATPAHVPAVWVDMTTLSSDRCSVAVAEVGEYYEKNAKGALKIVAVDGTLVRLSDASGRSSTFDLATDTFVG